MGKDLSSRIYWSRVEFTRGLAWCRTPLFPVFAGVFAMSEDTKFALCCWVFDICLLGIYAVAFCMIAEVVSAIW